MRKNTLIFLLVAVILAFDTKAWAISWEHDLAGALEKAKNEGKPVMADFYTDWCGWCKKLDKDVYEDAGVNRLAEKFICVKVNCELDKGAFAKYGLKGYPTIIFFNAAGGTEETVVGYRTAPVFADIMSKVLDRPPKIAASDKTAAVERPASPVAPVVKKERVAGEFELAGIMGAKAIINNKIVIAGDVVDNAEVVEITKDHVKLRYNNEDLTLNLQ